VTLPILELAGDIRDCAGRARDMGNQEQADRLHAIADELMSLGRYKESRDSTPPGVFADNQEARKTATERFREARRLLKGIPK
jgi:hypothetical protein